MFKLLILFLLSSIATAKGQILTVTAVEQTNYTCNSPINAGPECSSNPLLSCQEQIANISNGACIQSTVCCNQTTTTCYTQTTTCHDPPFGYTATCWNPKTVIVPYICAIDSCSEFAYQGVILTTCYNLTAYLLSSKGVISLEKQDCGLSQVCVSNFLNVYHINQTFGSDQPSSNPTRSSATGNADLLSFTGLISIIALIIY